MRLLLKEFVFATGFTSLIMVLFYLLVWPSWYRKLEADYENASCYKVTDLDTNNVVYIQESGIGGPQLGLYVWSRGSGYKKGGAVYKWVRYKEEIAPCKESRFRSYNQTDSSFPLAE